MMMYVYCSNLIGQNVTIVNLDISIRIANDIITFTQTGMTPLMSACAFGSAAAVRPLLEHGASVDLCNEVRDLQHAHTL